VLRGHHHPGRSRARARTGRRHRVPRDRRVPGVLGVELQRAAPTTSPTAP
jgi:hypothetical protein